METQKTMKLNKLNQKKTMEFQKIIKSQETMQTQEIRQTKETMKSSKITLAILASLSCLFLLFAGVNNLQAQEARQQGWSIGVSPFYLGAKIKTTTENTTLTEIVTETTRTLTSTRAFSASTTDNVPSDTTAGAELLNTSGKLIYSSNHDKTAIKAVEDICDDGSYNGMGTYLARQFDVNSIADATATSNIRTDACDEYFQVIEASFDESLTGTTVNSSLSRSVSSENTSLSGNGLQLGYDFEKFRLSFSLHQWSAGDNKLDSQIVLVDWHLPYGLYAGAGLAQAKLETVLGSDSKIAPAVHFGYKRNFSKNFSMEAGLLWVGAKLSVKQSAAAPEPTRTSLAVAIPEERVLETITSSILVGGLIQNGVLDEIYFFDHRIATTNFPVATRTDRRILVKGTVTPTYQYRANTNTYNTQPVPTKTTIEVEAPASLFIRFVYLFK